MGATGRLARARRAAAIALAACLAAAAPAAAAPTVLQPPPGGGPGKAPKADRDGDDVFDDLEQRLAPRPADARVDVIVTLESDASADRVRGLERRVGELAVSDRFDVVDAFTAEVTKRQVAALAARPGVDSIEGDDPVRALNKSGSDAFGVTAARLQNAKLDGDRDGNRNRYTTKDMVAAVIDTGIYNRHLDLDEGKVIGFADCTGSSCVRRTPYDNNGHGTHVAATLAGDGDALTDRRNRGVAPFGALVGVKSLDAAGAGSQSDVIRGVEWTIANRTRYGIEAVNMSLGGFRCSDGTDAMSVAANRAAGAGLVVVAAAGNAGPERCTVNAPAAASRVLAVGSMADPAHGGFFASWTSGRGQYGRPVKPDVMGPGIRVVSARSGTRTGYVAKSGTSTASPFVAGVALLMRDANSRLSAGEIRSRIKSSAREWGPAGADIDFGWGRLDAYAALRSAGVTSLDSPPRSPEHRLFEGTLTSTDDAVEYPIEVKNLCTPITASLIATRWRAEDPSAVDFDVYLKDPSGEVVNEVKYVNGKRIHEGASIERQDEVSHRPDRTGTWTLRVARYRGSEGSPYFADLSAGLSPPPYGAPATCSSR